MYGKMQEFGLIKIIPLIYILTIWGQYPVFLHAETPLGAAAVADGLMAPSSFVSL